ncbi:MAG: hypothetical protein LBU50_03945 [Cellulomonas sp.]|jgi:hypothetical protein|nr:hypothetical protein [Cellulomonas sp.]
MSGTQAARLRVLMGCLPEAEAWGKQLVMICDDQADRAGLAWEAVRFRAGRVAGTTGDGPPLIELRSLVAEIAVLLECNELAVHLARELVDMDRSTAIDLGTWPTAARLVEATGGNPTDPDADPASVTQEKEARP